MIITEAARHRDKLRRKRGLEVHDYSLPFTHPLLLMFATNER